MQVVVRPATKRIGADGNPLAIEVIILGNRRAALLVGLIGIVGVDTVARFAYALAVCVVEVAFGGQAGATDGAQAIFMVPGEILLDT